MRLLDGLDEEYVSSALRALIESKCLGILDPELHSQIVAQFRFGRIETKQPHCLSPKFSLQPWEILHSSDEVQKQFATKPGA